MAKGSPAPEVASVAGVGATGHLKPDAVPGLERVAINGSWGRTATAQSGPARPRVLRASDQSLHAEPPSQRNGHTDQACRPQSFSNES